MRLLLDSHVVLWWSEDSPRLSPAWAELLAEPANEIFISAASVWEIEIKKRIGKITVATTLVDVAQNEGITILDITPTDAVLAGSLDWGHKDPFDRMLVAQALERGLTILSFDAAMRTAPGVRFL